MGLLVLLLMLLIALGLIIIPTILNIGISLFFYKIIRSYYGIKTFFPKFIIFILISVLLTLNIRLPGIIKDSAQLLINPTIYDINTQLTIPRGSVITLVGNPSVLKFKRNYFESVRYEFSPAFGYKFVYPKERNEQIEYWLKKQGFKINRNSEINTKYKINLTFKSDDLHETVKMTLTKDSKVYSTYKKQFRKSFQLEKSVNSAEKTFLYLSQYNIWNSLFSILSIKEKVLDSPLSSFLSDAIIIAKPLIDIPTQYLTTTSETPIFYKGLDAKKKSMPKPSHLGWCNKGIYFMPHYKNGSDFHNKRGQIETGDRQGSWLVFKENRNEKLRVFIETPEFNEYVFSDNHLVTCTEDSVSILVSFWHIGESFNSYYKEKNIPRRQREKKTKEDGRTFWFLTYSWDGEPIKALNFKLSSKATYYETGINRVNKFYKKYSPISFSKTGSEKYQMVLIDNDKGYLINLIDEGLRN